MNPRGSRKSKRCDREHIGVFAKIEPLLGEIRSAFAPQFARSLEKLIDATPEGRTQVAAMRERLKAMRAEMAKQTAAANSSPA